MLLHGFCVLLEMAHHRTCFYDLFAAFLIDVRYAQRKLMCFPIFRMADSPFPIDRDCGSEPLLPRSAHLLGSILRIKHWFRQVQTLRRLKLMLQ